MGLNSAGAFAIADARSLIGPLSSSRYSVRSVKLLLAFHHGTLL
jgi:hypothetical protein